MDKGVICRIIRVESKNETQTKERRNQMQVLIESQEKIEGRIYFELSTEKKSAHISFNPELNSINVLCRNASHKAYKGMGRTFWNGWNEALEAYKSSDMKEMIKVAQSISENN